MTFAITLLLSIVDAITYRMGGSGNYPRFMRPLGTGIITMIILAIHKFEFSILYFVVLLISSGLTAVLSTTYLKKKGEDAKWWNWALVGLVLSLSVAPFAIYNHLYMGLLLRSIFLTTMIALWSESIGNAVIEELGRGFILIITLPVLFFTLYR